ncbi:MAG: PPC domain-containing protein, partial [Acidobacteria bacterium]|nr:PPC domain-containing protein [Acidobacteriota bacterium]
MRKPSRLIFRLCVMLICTAQLLLAQQTSSPAVPDAAQPLEQGKPIARELKAKETHAYSIALETGQFLKAAVNQRGIDLLVRVFAPDGSKLAEIDSPNGDQGDEPIALAAKTAGTYRIEVSSLEEE